MFSIFDTAAGVPVGRIKTSADRACDQCKWRKVRCNMGNPCQTCVERGFTCTYERARKKRGPIGRRISSIKRHQSTTSQPVAEDSGLSHSYSSTTVNSNGAAAIDEKQYVGVPSPNGAASQAHASTQHRDTNSSPDSFATASPSATMYSVEPWTSADRSTVYSQSSPQALVIPSLPLLSPSESLDMFGTILQQERPPMPELHDCWPLRINEATLLPWIDVYFKRLHPTVPLLNRTTLYRDMLGRRHHTDPQYGAMLMSLGAFAMLQPVQIHEVSSTPSRQVQAAILLDECVKMRTTSDFGEHPTIPMVLASFFLFACLFSSNQHKAARHRLREAVDLAQSLGLHLPHLYDGLDIETREQWLRTYLVLSVTERAYALQRRQWIGFRGSPAINARFMQVFDLHGEHGIVPPAEHKSDAVGMTGLLYLMATFDAIDESIIECWNGFCKYSDGACDAFDRRRALQMFRAQYRTREACVAGTASFNTMNSSLKLSQLMESQQADISLTQLWLLNRLWNLCFSHGLVRDLSDNLELRFDYACHIARSLVATCSELSLSALEVHGVGLMEKAFDVVWSVLDAMDAYRLISLDSPFSPVDAVRTAAETTAANAPMTVRTILQYAEDLFKSFRGGDHEYASRLATRLDSLGGYRGTS